MIPESKSMVKQVTLTRYFVAEQIHTLAQSAYRLEAAQIGCADFPPLRESLNRLRQSSDSFLAFQSTGSILGVLSFDRNTNPVTITRLVVSPAHLRQGVATALLAELERMLPPATVFTVSTSADNLPAVLFYRRFGYTTDGITKSREGIALIQLTKYNDRSG